MKTFLTILFVVTVYSGTALSQSYSGPAAGSIAGGASISTNNFEPDGPAGYPGPIAERVHNKIPYGPLPAPANMAAPTGPEGSNLIIDRSVSEAPPGPPPITIASFQGIPQTNSIPPDPHCAAGPNHIISVVNSSFRISDKSGTTLKTISADSWFQNVLPSPGAFDPKVRYDHFAGRWIMVWLNQNDATQTSYFFISVSDDDNPIGTWYNWALPSNVNGSTNAGNWGDYQGVGFDNQAIYLTTNQFSFAGSYNYTKIRIIGKAQLYANTAGPVTWSDIWGLTDLFGNDTFGVRPSIVYGAPNEFYLVLAPNFTFGTYFVLFRILNPLTLPAVTAVHIPVTSWSNAPNANQLGGSTILIEGGGSRIRNEPVYMDSSIWVVHSIANGAYSSVRYVRLSTLTNTALEDGAMGASGFWYIWPAIAVDKDKNVALTFSRSGLTEYIGAFMSWRLNTDPVNTLRPSFTIQAGKANYVKDFGSGRNRWGDYMGIALDPADRNNFWMFTEYAETPANTWATWWHNTRLVPFSGSRIFSTLASKDFGLVESGFSSDTTTITLFNVGSDQLSISSISRSQPAYSFIGLPSFPANLATYDSVTFKVFFHPTSHGVVNDTVVIASNDLSNPTMKIPLHAKGIVVGRAQVATIYSASQSGQLYSINATTGVPTAIGPTGLSNIEALAIRPSNKELISAVSNSANTVLYRMSTGFGDALQYKTIPIPGMRAIAFTATGDTLYGATTAGRVYRINVATGDTTFLGANAGFSFASLSVSPTSGKLWAGVTPPLTNKDRIYTINTSNGAATLVGSTGLTGQPTHGLAFNALGLLFGVTGRGTQINNFIGIDTTTALGTLIGSTGLQSLNGLALRTDSLTTGVENNLNGLLPETYVLQQNYPNPFNPTTKIVYRVKSPATADRHESVSLKVYDMLGREVATLVNEKLAPGWYETTFDAKGFSGGVYFYRLVTGSFVETKKMLLLK